MNNLIKARCFWCGQGFKRVTLGGLEPYLCSTEACAKKQLEGALWVETKAGKRLVYVPTPKGRAFELATTKFVLFGGAAGGSKSYSMRWLAHKLCLQYPRYRVLLLRQNLTELKTTHVQEGLEFEEAILPFKLNRTELYGRYDNGSILQLGHLDNVTQYLSTQYDTVMPDELVTMEERTMKLIFSRIGRRGDVPYGVRAGTNPGGREAAWVKRYFVDKDVDRVDDPAYRPENYLYIPSTVEDNPYLNPLYLESLLGLPEDLREAYLRGNWDIFPGQFFTEWRNRTLLENGHIVLKDKFSHVYPHADYPESYLRLCAIDWGYVKPGWAGWFVVLPDGHAYLEEEYVFQRTQAPEVARQIAKRQQAKGLQRVRYIGDYEMWGPNADSGESTAETFARFGVSMQQADKERKNGWVRFRAWMRAAPDGKPWLMSSERNKYFNRTVPAQISDETNPEDIDHRSNTDHAADGGRYFATSRPHPDESARIQVYGPNTVGALKAQIAKRIREGDRINMRG